MKKFSPSYNKAKRISALVMMLVLAWLTVSLPIVVRASSVSPACGQLADRCGDTKDPFANTTEEKTPTSISLSEEFLHDHHNEDRHPHLAADAPFFHHENESDYTAFHGELLCPPPNCLY